MFDKEIKGDVKEFVRKAALYIANNHSPESEVDRTYWERFNSTFERNRFEYLQKIGQFELPFNDRHVPLQRRLLDRLLAEKVYRKHVYSVHADDYESRKEKFEESSKNFSETYLDYFLRKSDVINKQILEVQTKREYMDQMIQQQIEAQKQTGQVMNDPRTQLQLKLMDIEFNKIVERANDLNTINDEFIDEFKSLRKMTALENLESIITKFLKNIEKNIRFEEIKIAQFKAKMVTGKTAFFVGKLYGSEPRIISLNPSGVCYPMDSTSDKIQSRDWAYFTEYMSYSQVQEKFLEDLMKFNLVDDIEKLNKNYSTGGTATLVSLPSGDAVFVNYNNFEDAIGQNIKVKHVWLRGSIRKYRKTSIDKNGNTHKHIMKGGILINTDDYNYSSGVFTHKKNPQLKYNKSDVTTYSKSKDTLDKKSLESIYYAVVIEDSIVIPYGLWEDTIRSNDNYNRFNLPIFGPAHDKQMTRPYSLIGATNDIQDLIDIIYVAREYMIATAGTKTQLIDKSFKPDGMKDDEWDYQIKMGKLYIQTMTANGQQKASTFNQWNTFDNSLPQSITYFDNIIDNLMNLMGNIIGISYQSLGTVINTDQVATNKMAIQQSSLVTEMLFWDQEQIEKDVLEEYLSLILKQKIEQGKDIYFMDYNLDHTKNYILNVKQIKERDWRIILYDSAKDKELMDMLRQYIMSQKQNIGLSIGTVMKIWNSDTLKEMEYKLEYYENKAIKLQQQAASSQIQSETDAKKQLMQFDTELQAQLQSITNQLTQAQLELTKANNDAKNQAELMKINLENTRIGLEGERIKNDRMKVMSDVATEKGMLISQDKHATVQEQLEYLSIMIDAIARGEDLKTYNREIDVKKIAAMKKPGQQHVNDN